MGDSPASAQAMAASVAVMAQVAQALIALQTELSPTLRAHSQPAVERDGSAWGNIGSRGQEVGDQGDSYAVVHDSRGLAPQEASSKKRAMSLVPSQPSLWTDSW